MVTPGKSDENLKTKGIWLLGGGLKHLLFSSLAGEMIQFD